MDFPMFLAEALMPSMMVRYAGSKVFVALQATEFGQEGIDEGAEVCLFRPGWWTIYMIIIVMMDNNNL